MKDMVFRFLPDDLSFIKEKQMSHGLCVIKDILAVFAIMLLALLILNGCSAAEAPAADPHTDPDGAAGQTQMAVSAPPDTTAPATDAWGLPLPTGAASPGEAPDLTAARGSPEWDAPFTDSDWLSPHGFWPGMTMEAAYLLWPFDNWVVDASDNPTEYDWRAVYVGNMRYLFRPLGDAPATSYSDYYLAEIYYGATIYGGISAEPLCVLRNVQVGDDIQEVLGKLPGGGLARRWAQDQIIGEHAAPGSMDLSYQTSLSFYALRIYTESAYLDIHFGASGKLGFATIYTY